MTPEASASPPKEADCKEATIKQSDGTTKVVCIARATTTETTVYRPPRPRARPASQPVPDLTILRRPIPNEVPPPGGCRPPGTPGGRELLSTMLANPSIAIQWVSSYRCGGEEPPPPRELARQVIEEVGLPAPVPVIAPGWAITGMRGYLEPSLTAPVIDGRPTVSATRTTELGEMAVTATAVYRVDWGDGERTGPVIGPGGPWPDGNLTHTWTTIGTYDVVVAADWTVRWRMGAASGTLTTTTEGRIEAFRVDQLQAVRNR
ncbi:MAG: hypothetical protein ACR2MO_08890 [Acidimicrobiales bacterium]